MAYRKPDPGQPSAEDRALDKFAELMIEKIESIKEDWKKPWFTAASLTWPKNLSGREYNGMNALMLMFACEKHDYKIPVFMTFDRVVGLNYQKGKDGKAVELKDESGQPLPRVGVQKGEKSFPVFITTFTVIDKETGKKIPYDDFKALTDEEKQGYKVYPKLNVYNVFNVDQTNMKEARPELYRKLEEENTRKKPEQSAAQAFAFPAVDRMIKENQWICPIKEVYGNDAYYSISKNEIVLPEKTQFKDGEAFYGTAFHEMAHSTGAESQLGRLKPSAFGSSEYAREELVAELTAALVAQRYGIIKNLKEDSAAYLRSWINTMKESPDFLKTTLQDVKKASAVITQKIDTLQLAIENEMANQEKEPSKVFVPVVTDMSEKSEEYQTVETKNYDVPSWALPYIFYGDAEGITDEEKEIVDKFLEKNFPEGFTPVLQEGSEKELNTRPAFGTRNANAVVSHGESPYEAVDTVRVEFHDLRRSQASTLTAHPDGADAGKVESLVRETAGYAVEHVTGEGYHTGIAWVQESYEELCSAAAAGRQLSSEETAALRHEMAGRVIEYCRNQHLDRLSPDALHEVIERMDELEKDAERSQNAGISR